MTPEHAFAALTRDDEPARRARSLLLWNLWDVLPTVTCVGSTDADGSRLGRLGLGCYGKALGRSPRFTINQAGLEMADSLRAMGYKADGRIK